MQTTNKVVVIISQNTVKTVKGNDIKVFRKPQTFTSETVRQVTAENVGCWLADVLRKWQLAQKLQGLDAFDMSCAVDMEIIVSHGNHIAKESMSAKIAISPNKLKSVLSKYPNLIGIAFVPDLNVADATRNKVTARALAYSTKVDDKTLLDYGSVVLAKHTKELPAPEVKQENVEHEEVINDGQLAPEVLLGAAEEVTINA